MADFTVTATAEESVSAIVGAVRVFRVFPRPLAPLLADHGPLETVVRVDWDRLPMVFGITVEPREAKALPFPPGAQLQLAIEGATLTGVDAQGSGKAEGRGVGAWQEESETRRASRG